LRAAGACETVRQVSDWDIVLRGGRVIDPESGLDAIADVAIEGDRVAEIGPGLGPGRAEADVTGLVVTAGFIDLHSHVNTIAGLRLQVLDGVTTALEMEVGVQPVPAWYAAQKKLAQAPALHPVQQAMLDEQALQCGYCYNGMIVKASELLSKAPDPSEAQIRAAMNGHICRCGTYPRIIQAVQRASRAMAGAVR